jgi:Ankyrin repeats (many copies)
MLRSCLILLVAYALLFAGYLWWLEKMFDPRGVYIGAAVVALLVGGCLGTLYNARVAYREWSLVAAARHGMPYSDGRWTAVAGEIHPAGEPLKAPFSGEDCVLCEYDVASQHRIGSTSGGGDSKPGSDFAGFLMNPCVVRGDQGEMRLLGFPNLEGFGERVCKGPGVAANARAFLTGTEFENYSGLKMVTVFSAIKAAWSDDDGLVRKNIRLGKTTPQSMFPELQTSVPTQPMDPPQAPVANNLQSEEDELDDELDDEDLEDDQLDDEATSGRGGIPLLKEKRVKVGEKVCAIGIYSGEKRGLIPGGLGADHFIKLIRGRAADIERASRNSAFGRFFGGLFFLLVVNGVTFGAMQAARYNSKLQTERRREAFQIASQDGNVARLSKLIERGVDMNSRDESGQPLLAVAAVRSPDVTRWLIDHGADVNVASEHGLTPLMGAASRGDADMVKLLLDAKADVNLRNKDNNFSALTYALRDGNPVIAELLRKAGAKEDSATAEAPQ